MDKEHEYGQLKSFERAFDSGTSGCWVTCSCGRRFFDVENEWDWNDGEIERLHADPNATALNYAAQLVEFEGITYASDCTCWHERARKVIHFLVSERDGIGDFYKNEAERLKIVYEQLARAGGIT